MTQRATPALREADVTKQVIGWLRAKGWACYRLQSGVVRGVTRGTFMRLSPAGTPDWFAVRADRALFVEMKSPGKKLEPAQENWFALARSQGTPAIWADSLEMFQAKYAEVGLL